MVRRLPVAGASMVARLLCSTVTRTPFTSGFSVCIGRGGLLAEPCAIDAVDGYLVLGDEVPDDRIGHGLRVGDACAAVTLHLNDVPLL